MRLARRRRAPRKRCAFVAANSYSRKPDGRSLRRYRRRWKVERRFAWLKQFRRINIRWDHKGENFFGIVHLGCLVVRLRHL